MTQLQITPDMSATPWADLATVVRGLGTITRIGLLPAGMDSGRPSVGVAVQMRGGETILAEVSWQQLRAAVMALDGSPVALADHAAQEPAGG